MAKVNVSPARWLAFEILRKVEDGAFSSVLLAEHESQLKDADRALCHELVLGVLRWQRTLDELITHFSNRRIGTLDRGVLIALRLGLYQLRFLTRIPASAAVDESVKLVQATRLSSASTLVNAVLRRATRERDHNPVENVSDPITKLAIETSHPDWLVRRWVDSFGFEEACGFARSNNEAAGTSFRLIHSRSSEAEVLGKLQKDGIDPVPSSVVAGGWTVRAGSKTLRQLAIDGAIYFQDEASQLVAEVVDAKERDKVLDLCAAPGGKTTLIADRNARATVFAGDSSAKRLATVSKTVATQRLKNVSLLLLNAAEPLPFADATFDRVLVDAPCSGTGTLRHNPEIRWRITNEDISRLGSQQLQFLDNAARVLKSSGKLVYSTCSVENEENEVVVANFSETNRDFRQIVLKHERLQTTSTGALRTWPHRDDTDGFFIAAFEKKE